MAVHARALLCRSWVDLASRQTGRARAGPTLGSAQRSETVHRVGSRSHLFTLDELDTGWRAHVFRCDGSGLTTVMSCFGQWDDVVQELERYVEVPGGGVGLACWPPRAQVLGRVTTGKTQRELVVELRQALRESQRRAERLQCWADRVHQAAKSGESLDADGFEVLKKEFLEAEKIVEQLSKRLLALTTPPPKP